MKGFFGRECFVGFAFESNEGIASWCLRQDSVWINLDGIVGGLG
jgi:hypothetical protein